MDNLLIVTQEKGTRESLKIILKDRFLLLVAENKEEALSILREKPVDLALLDTPASGTDISTLVAEVKKIKDELVIVILSAFKEDVSEKLRAQGVYEVVNKPFSGKELLNVISKAQEKSGLLRELKFLRAWVEKKSRFVSEKSGKDEPDPRTSYYYQEAIRKFSKSLTYVLDLPRLLDSIVTAVAEISEVNRASILLKEQKTSAYRIRASTGLRENVVKEIKLKEGEGVAGWLQREERILRKEDLREEPFPEQMVMIRELDMLGAHLCLPLSTQGNLIAIISLGRKITGDKFSSEDIRLLVTMAGYAAAAIHNSLLYQEITFWKNYQQIIMKNIPTGVITMNNEGKITTINKAGREILKLGEGAIIGEDIQRAGSIIADIMLRTLEEERVYHRHEVILPGENISLGTSTSLLRNEKGETIGGVMVFSDLSEVRRLEEKIRKLEKEKMWREFAEGIAHKVRNPLVSIRTFTQLFLHKYQDKEFRKDFYRVMGRDVERLDKLIGKLEKYAEPLSLNLQTEKIHSVIDKVLANPKKLVSQKITVNKKYSSNIPRIVMDREQLTEAFSQLVNNSIEAMPRGGTITVVTKINPEENGEVLIEFSDTGKGIPRENIKKLFSPFFSAPFKGLGLGLPLARKIIELHGGRIKVDSTPGKGTSLKIFLPLTLDVNKFKEENISTPSLDFPAVILPGEGLSLQEAVESFEKNLIQHALLKNDAIQTKTAQSLKISRRVLKYKMDKLGIKEENINKKVRDEK